MVRRFFLDKCNTIIKNSNANIGLSPVAELNYGKGVSRILLHFDHNEIKKLVNDKTFANPDKVTYHLKMTNCASIDPKAFYRYIGFSGAENKRRASSFDIAIFKLKQHFDAGRGYEHYRDLFKDEKSYDENGCTWYQSKNGLAWSTGEGALNADDFGLQDMCDKYELGEPYEDEHNVFIGMQHFDYGDENLDIDITDYVNECLDYDGVQGNFGIGLCFVPRLENAKLSTYEYVGFFTNNTNTVFHPYVEAVYDEVIDDCRKTFYIGKENRLYLYCNIGGEYENLDELPTCEVDDVQYPVQQATKGVYYCTIPKDVSFTKNTIKEDVWQNLKYDGVTLDDITMEFVPLAQNIFFNIGNEDIRKKKIVPSVYGINSDEKVKQGELRKVVVDFRKQYTANEREITDKAEYRLYMKDGDREVDVYGGYLPVEKMFLENFFNIYTEDLIPTRYYVDIAVNYNRERLIFKNVLTFDIADDVTERRV